MKKKYYTQPTMQVVKINLHKFIMQSEFTKGTRHDYGTASKEAGTEQTWD